MLPDEQIDVLLGVDDLGQAVSPGVALCQGTGFEYALLARLQRAHT